MNWYAVRIKPNQEAIALSSIDRLGIEVFCPFLRQAKVIRRKRQIVTGPLFPGYLFARFNVDIHFRAVNYSHGSLGLVTFGSVPAELDDGLIASIRSRMEDGYVTICPKTIRPGDAVRIEEGPLMGLEAVFEREMTDQERVILLLNTLSYQARVVVDRDMVTRL